MDKIAKALERAREERQEEEKSRSKKPGLLHPPGDEHYQQAHQGYQVEAEPVSVHDSDNAPAAGGVLSTETGTLDPKLIVYHDPESLAAEHFKLLRSRIIHPTDGREYKTIMITSAMDNAGKTLVACNLALSIAQGIDPYALLIDADVRRSTIPGLFGFESKYGLTDYLMGRQEFANCLIKPAVSKLTILPAGSPVPNPAEIITSSRMKALIEEAKHRYSDRFIIIDSPPVNLASETVDLAKLVDTVLLVVRCGESSKPLIEEAIKRLGRERIMGIVFNAYERPRGRYGYYKEQSS